MIDDEDGLLTGLLLSKLGVALAVICLIGSCMTMHGTLERAAEREDLATMAESAVATIRTVNGLPGRVDLKREFPSTHRPCSIEILGSYENFQKICILVKGGTENVRRFMFIEKKVNGGNFGIERENPRMIQIRKSDQIFLDVI